MKKMLQSIVLGDWSNDGHNQSMNFIFKSNKSDDALRKAFRESCSLTGYMFDVNDPLPDKLIPKARLLCNYQDDTLTPKVIDDLVKNFALEVKFKFFEFLLATSMAFLEMSKPIPFASLISLRIVNKMHPVPVPMSKKFMLLPLKILINCSQSNSVSGLGIKVF